MKFQMEFDCDNAAFEDGMATEIARTLIHVARQVFRGGIPDTPEVSTIRDVNGNEIGSWKIKED